MLQKITANKKYLLLSVLFFTLIVYFPTLFFHYVYLDDYLAVQEPGFHNNLSNIPGSFFRSLWTYSSTSYQYYRPVSISLYILCTWISQQISGETLPWIFHLTNLLLQLCVVALLFNLLIYLGATLLFSTIATLLFSAHPALAGTIGWISGQNELLMSVLILSSFLSLIQYVQNQKNKWLFIHSFLFLLALLTKENAIVLPVLMAIYLVAIKYPWRRFNILIFSWIGSIAVWFAMMKLGAGQANPITSHVVESIIKALPYSLVYLGKMLLPFPLPTLPTFYDASSITLIAGGFALILMMAAWYYSKSRWFVLLGIAWYFGFLLPTFAIAGLQTEQNFILREDRGYLAAIGFWLISLQIVWPQVTSKLKNIGLVVLILSFVLLNMINQQNYSNGKAFYTSAVAGSPHLAFAHTHLADMYLTEKDFSSAILGYQKALELNPRQTQAHNNLGVLYLRTQQPDKAIEEFQAELQFNPNNILSLYNLGSIFFNQNKLSEAEAVFRKAVTINPVYTDAWKGLLAIYTVQKNEVKAEEARRGLAQSEWDMSKGL